MIDEAAREYGISQEDVRAAIGYAARVVFSRRYLIQADQLVGTVMPEQIRSLPKKEEKMGKGLTAEQRRHLEKSLKENDELMKCLAEM